MISCVVTAAFVFISIYFYRTRKTKHIEKDRKNKELNNAFEQLLFSGAEYQADYFTSALYRRKNSKTIKSNGSGDDIIQRTVTGGNSFENTADVTVIKHNNTVFVTKNNHLTIYYPYLKYNALDSQALSDIYFDCGKFNPDEIVILSSSCSLKTRALSENIKNLKIKIFEKDDVIKIIEEYGVMPKNTVELIEGKAKPAISSLLLGAINPRRTKGYIFASIFLTFSSLFMKGGLYYLLVASFLFILACVSFFSPLSKLLKVKQ